jgi:hypothetical protein
MLILFGCIVTELKAQSMELSHVREIFHRPVSQKNVEEVLNLQADQYNSPTIKAYQAVTQTMMAEYVSNPFTKLSYFNKGKKQLEEILVTTKTIETVYLRLLIQLNVPSMLNYYSKIETDLDYFCLNFDDSKIDAKTKKLFIETLLISSKIGEYQEEKKRIQNLLV